MPFKIVISLLFSLLATASNAQIINLVPNSSFENYIHCPNQGQENLNTLIANGWFSPLTSPDYFNSCAASWERQVPINRYGSERANTGNSYIGFSPFGYTSSLPPTQSPNYWNQLRETIGVKLDYRLSKDSVYTVGFYVSLADTMAFTIKNWGCMFSEDSISLNTCCTSLQEFTDSIDKKFINNTNCVKVDLFPDNALTTLKGWKKVEATFKANGGEQFMYIGNFINHADIQWENSPNFAQIDTATCQCQGAYYYIDDVYLNGDTNYKAVGINENIFEQIKVYPNPANDFITINIGNLKNIQLELFDISGRKLFQQKLASAQQNIGVSSLSNGVYICTVISNNQIVKREKIIIQR